MKKFTALLLTLISLFAITSTAFADTWVNGYNRKDGTRVRSHWRSDADGNQNNNWTHRGNINPHTGSRGYR